MGYNDQVNQIDDDRFISGDQGSPKAGPDMLGHFEKVLLDVIKPWQK